MGNELSGVLREEDVEVTVKLLIRRRKDQHSSQLQQQQQQENSVPSEEGDGGEEEEDSYDEDDEDDEEEDEEHGDKLVDELLENEGDLPPKLTLSGGKRRGRPPKVKGEGSGGEAATPRARKKAKVGAGRPSSVKVRSNSEHPILDVCIAKTHLSPSFCLNVPPEFANAYLDVSKEYTVVNGVGCKTLGLCLKNKRCVVKRSHWKAIVEEHKLKSGDTVHLELIPGDQVRIQVSKCEEGLALDFSDAAQQQVHEAVEKIVHLDQNGHAAVIPVDLEKHHVVAAVTVCAAPPEQAAPPVNPTSVAAPVVAAQALAFVVPAAEPAVPVPVPAPVHSAVSSSAAPAPAEVQ